MKKLDGYFYRETRDRPLITERSRNLTSSPASAANRFRSRPWAKRSTSRESSFNNTLMNATNQSLLALKNQKSASQSLQISGILGNRSQTPTMGGARGKV